MACACWFRRGYLIGDESDRTRTMYAMPSMRRRAGCTGCHSAGALAVGILLAAPAYPQSDQAQDDHGNRAEAATLLEVGDTVAGVLDAGDSDVFRLDVHGTADFEVRTSGQTNTNGELRTGSGVHVASDDDSGPDENFSITSELAAGVYYVTVAGEPGQYAVNARLAGRADHGDTPATSSLLPVRGLAEIQSVSPAVLLAMAGRIHPSPQDVDVFRIDIEREMGISIRSSPGSFDLDGVLSDESGTVVGSDDGEGGFRIGSRMRPGTYYLTVTSSEVGAYRVLAQTVDFDTDDAAWGIAHARGRLYVVGGDHVWAYTVDGVREPDRDFQLADTGFLWSPHGMTYVNGAFYVAEWWDEHVYAYDESGAKVPGRDFDLAENDDDTADDNSSPEGIMHVGGTFYVVDFWDEKVYAYRASGSRVRHSEFQLAPGNVFPRGITHVGDTFYVVDSLDQQVYAYDASGNLVPGKGFELAPLNTSARGIAYAQGRFYVVDGGGRVYAYEADDGGHNAQVSFELPLDGSLDRRQGR